MSDTQDLLGIEGAQPEPWCSEFQTRAVEIYQLTLPAFYLARLASSFAGAALVIEQRFPADKEEFPWSILRSYFDSAQIAISKALDVTVVPSAIDPPDSPTTTPGVVRFDLIAQEVSGAGIAKQIEAAELAVSILVGARTQTIPPEYLKWLKHLAAGGRVVDLAVASGYSERSMYRLLKRMWSELGVANLRQGVTLAVERGWIEDPI